MSEQIIVIGDLQFYVRNDRDAVIAREVAYKKAYERPRRGFRIEGSERWLDCGANIGAFTCWAAKKTAAVMAVEACAANVEMVKKNLRANGLFAVVKHGFVSLEQGLTNIHYNADTPGRSGKFSKKGIEEQVENAPLAEMLQSFAPAGLKLDIEGGEFDLLDAGFPLDGLRAVAMEYHYRFDKSCANARRRIERLRDHFKDHIVSKQTLTAETWGGWVDEMMFFWNPR